MRPEADAITPGRWLLACVLKWLPEYAAYGPECEPPAPRPMTAPCVRWDEISPPLFLEAPTILLMLKDAHLVRLWCGDAARAVFPAHRFSDASNKHMCAHLHIASQFVSAAIVPHCCCTLLQYRLLEHQCQRQAHHAAHVHTKEAVDWASVTSALRLCKTHHDADFFKHHSRSHHMP